MSGPGCHAGARLALLAVLIACAANAAPAPLPPFGAATRLLVIAPHPDDETLCCAGVMQAVLQAGGRVSVVWMTSGDGSRLDSLAVEHNLFPQPAHMRALGETRMQEARHAVSLLGIAPAQQYFLGYPDRGLQALLTDHFHTPFQSPFTGVSQVPYPDARTSGHPYTGQDLERDLTGVVREVNPTLILAPTPRDAHPDHSASGILAARVLGDEGAPESSAHILYWIVHGGGGWPTPRGLARTRPMDPAPRMAGLPLRSWELTPAQVQRKLQAIEAYHTQTRVMVSFLLAFVRSSELFATLPEPPGTDATSRTNTR